MPEMHVIFAAVHRDGSYLSFDGTVTPAPGSTRQSVFRDLLTHVAGQSGRDPRAYTPLFFALEPNQLTHH